jgi:flagellar biosynthetic protein FliO
MIAALHMLLATQSAAPNVKDLPSFGDALVRMCISLGVIVLVLIVLTVMVRRLRRARLAPRGGGSMRVVETLDLDLRNRIYLVEVAGESMVLGVGSDHVAVLRRQLTGPSARSAPPSCDDSASATASSPLRDAALTFSKRTTS